MKDLVDFGNREDFDSYMKQIERNYYEQLNIPKPPYEQLPEFPPKPYQSNKSNINNLVKSILEKRSHEEQGKDYIDKINDLNARRQNAYSFQANGGQGQLNTQNQFYQPTHNNHISSYMTPFFDSVVNKENFSQSVTGNGVGGFQQPIAQNQTQGSQQQYYQAQYSQAGIIPQNGIPQGFAGPDKYGQFMEPQRMNQAPPYMQKFVAGAVRLEHNPLSEPLRSFRGGSGTSPPRQNLPPNDFDFKNPDSQYERYKSLMSNQYYNNHANSGRAGYPSATQRTIYQPPFVQPQLPPQQFQNPQQYPPQQQFPNTPGAIGQDMFNVSFNPRLGNSLQQTQIGGQQQYGQQTQRQGLPAGPSQGLNTSYSRNPQLQQQYPGTQSQMYPPSQSIYNRPGQPGQPNIPNLNSYYGQQQQNFQQPMQGPGVQQQWGRPQAYQNVNPQMYRSMKQQNNVGAEVIESIGGIEDTIKPLEETLKQHELRPYQIQHDYRKEYQMSKKGYSLKRSNSEMKPENLKLVSVSPFRAVIKVEDDGHHRQSYQQENEQQQQQENEDQDDEEIERDDDDQPKAKNTAQSDKRGRSPIKTDSEFLRGQREQFLRNFSDKRSTHSEEPFIQDQRAGIPPGVSRINEQQKVKTQSEHLRNQREQFLSGFSGQGYQIQDGYGRPPISSKGYVPNLNINV